MNDRKMVKMEQMAKAVEELIKERVIVERKKGKEE